MASFEVSIFHGLPARVTGILVALQNLFFFLPIIHCLSLSKIYRLNISLD